MDTPDSFSQIRIRADSAGASLSPCLTLIVDEIRTGTPEIHGIFSGYQWESLRGKLLRAGIDPGSVSFRSFSPDEAYDQGVIVGLGENTLRGLTDKRGMEKWNMSLLKSKTGHTFIPTFDLSRTQKQYELNTYVEMALRRAHEELVTPHVAAAERFLLNPGIEETLAILEGIKDESEIAVDVETGYGQINTVGFAWSESDAIAINVLPDRCSDQSFHALWSSIARVLEGGSRKIFQNFIYDVSYFSAYGIRVENIYHDTMHAMKVLWPEFDMNLGNVGRFYTKRPYWKDDGKVESEEGKKKDWGNVRDWTRHYVYNCRDTTGTLEASRAQRLDLMGRGLSDLYEGYIQKLTDSILEMCSNGIPVSASKRDSLRAEIEKKVEELSKRLQEEVGAEINHRSPKQVQSYLKGQGVKLPKKYDKAKGVYKETTDAAAIKKIRLKHPDIKALSTLARVKTLDTMLSRYINFDMLPDSILRYSLNMTGTETLRFSGGSDPWDRGINIQTVPREGSDVSIKSMFVAPEGESFLEVDLRQAESRFVAYDSADKNLIDMLEGGEDVHTHIGNAILRQMGNDPSKIDPVEFKTTWRQLGKKAGHGLNYFMKAAVFVETVFDELDIVITKKDAELITEAYYGLFPGIPRWHRTIERELYTKRKLTTPFGWERYFYGRPGPDMLKEGLAFRPQSTIPWITNRLMLHLREERKRTGLKFKLHTQVHDSLLLSCPDESLNDVCRSCHKLDDWAPRIELAGGVLRIPVETKIGKSMDQLKEWEG